MRNTKEVIVQKALKLFLEKGFYQVSMSMIAAAVGISKPAIYFHFKNKDDLVEGVLDYFTARMKSWNQQHFNGLNPGKETLQMIFKAIPLYKNVEQILLADPPEERRYSFNELLITLSKYKPEFKERIARDIKGGTDKISESLQYLENTGDFDKAELALYIHAVIEGCAFLSEVRSDLDLQKISDNFFKITCEIIND